MYCVMFSGPVSSTGMVVVEPVKDTIAAELPGTNIRGSVPQATFIYGERARTARRAAAAAAIRRTSAPPETSSSD